MFRLENSRSPEDLRAVVAHLVEWLRSPEQEGLRRSFTVWVKRVLLPARLPGIDLPQVTNLQEVNAMLAERVMEWTEQWKRQGLQQGLQQGEAALFLRLAELRFGPLSADTRHRIESADAETLLRWGENLLSAGSLDEVFSEP